MTQAVHFNSTQLSRKKFYSTIQFSLLFKSALQKKNSSSIYFEFL